MPFRRRPHQRGLPFAPFRRVDIRAARDQLLHHLGAARVGGDHERRLAVPTGRIGVRPGLQQLLDEHGVSVGRGQRERRLPILIGSLHVGAGGQQEVGRLAVVQIGGPRQGGSAIGLRRVDIGVLREQRSYGLTVAPLDGLRQAKIARRPSGPGCQNCRQDCRHAAPRPGSASHRCSLNRRGLKCRRDVRVRPWRRRNSPCARRPG